MKVYQVTHKYYCSECNEHQIIRSFDNRAAAEEFIQHYEECDEDTEPGELTIYELEVLTESPTLVEVWHATYSIGSIPYWDWDTSSLVRKFTASRSVGGGWVWSDMSLVGQGVFVRQSKFGLYVSANADTKEEAERLRDEAIPVPWRLS